MSVDNINTMLIPRANSKRKEYKDFQKIYPGILPPQLAVSSQENTNDRNDTHPSKKQSPMNNTHYYHVDKLVGEPWLQSRQSNSYSIAPFKDDPHSISSQHKLPHNHDIKILLPNQTQEIIVRNMTEYQSPSQQQYNMSTRFQHSPAVA